MPVAAGLALCAFVRAAAGDAIEWPAYGRDLQGTRYLPAARITRDNVDELEVA